MKNKHIPVLIFALIYFSPFISFAIDNNECMECHGDESIVRTNSHGSNDQISFDYREFQYSIHNINGIGCVDCHSDITKLDMDNDPPHPIEMAQVVCSNCHEEEGENYERSVHAQANKKGMSIHCTACHSYHFTKSLANKPVLERENGSCLKCHDPFKFHNWLPQKESHFTYVECTVCHSPDAPRHIHLRLYDLVTKSFTSPDTILTALDTDQDSFMDLLDSDGSGSLSRKEFENMVFILKRKGIHATFHGELLSEHQPLIHQVSKAAAQRNCEDCHLPASPFFEAVTLFFPHDNGTVDHYVLDRDVLETYTLSNFYMPGGTRIRELDIIGVLMIIGAVFGISGHQIGRMLTVPLRRKRNDKEAARNNKKEAKP
nr:hypothetical protein [Desulfobulbaceae bacterium]